MFKMICLDLDGTLLRSDKTIASLTSSYLNQLAEEGIRVVVATGRHFDYADYLTKDILGAKYIIANNGAGIFDIKNKATISSTYIDERLVYKFINLSQDHGLDPIVYTNAMDLGIDMVVSSDLDTSYHIENLVRNNDRIGYIEDGLGLNKALALVIYGNVSELRKFEIYIDDLFKDRVNCHIMDSTYDDMGMLEIMDASVHKWTGIAKLAKKLNVCQEEIVCFGDAINDIEMIRNAGLGVAMKNSNKIIFPYADRITMRTNDEDGVYYELKELFKEG